MPSERLSSGFDALRPWRGSQARAFEELCYQLFAADAPDGSRAIRTGDPDGGVEWYADLADGSRWGWQAKHVHDLDALLAGMTESVKAVVQDHPDLTKLTFLISVNLNTARQGGARKSQREKYDDKVATWRTSIPGAADLTIDLIQESDILARLARPEHAGRQWFWWGTTEFTEAWYHAKLKGQVEVAGEKYRPDLQVDLPIEDDLAALGFDATTLDRLDELRRAIVAAAADFWLADGPAELHQAYDSISSSVDQMKAVLSTLHIEPPTVASNLASLHQVLKTLRAAVTGAIDLERAAEEQWRTDHPDHGHHAARENSPHEARGYKTDNLLKPVRELERWLESTAGQAMQRGLYFLDGAAGSGKTHLLLEATHRALQVGRPAVFLTAARFGRGDLWSSMCDQLGLPPLGADVLLGAMDAAGEASALTGRRFVISIDALNETTDTEFWRTHLPVLRAAVSQWPHVALAVSCRDTYVDVVCEDAEQNRYVTCSHPGFAGHEVDATQKFFAFHGLQTPRIPLLLPEFSLPLFLKLFCEGLRESGATGYDGHEGRVTIFQRYLEGKLARIARRLRPHAATQYELTVAHRYVLAVRDAILDELADTGREGLTFARAEQLAAAALDSAADATVVLGAMQSEGILNQELLYLGTDDGMVQGLRIVFQALADFMILRRRLERSPDPLSDNALHAWLRDSCSRGIVEAAAVALPELYGVELPDLLGLTAKTLQQPDRHDTTARRRYQRNQHILASVVQSLPYRKAAAVTDRTVELLNESLRFISREDLFRVMFLIAPQPDNQLNAERLHKHLATFAMPKRDAYFGFATYHVLSDETSAAAVLARWASKGPYPEYDPMVVELAAIPLVWLLGSPNRYMRDWITKALVQLLRGHLAVAERLLVRFWPINDPYIVQRVLVIAYGAVMRSDTSQADAAKGLVARVRSLAFSPPVRADEILLDAARGLVEWGVTNGLAPKSHLNSIRRPYGLKPPGPAPKEEQLEARYGWKEGQPDEESYSTILHSILGMGDFGRYVIEPGLGMFSRHPLVKPYPDPVLNASDRTPTIVKSRWAKFIKSLSSDQQTQLAEMLKTQPEGPVDRIEAFRSGFWQSLTEEQSRLFAESYRQPRSRFRDDDYPAHRAKRWVFARTLRLGWTPERFGSADRYLGYQSSGREAHKAERWGKKYQWMAYHELLARVADNFHAAHLYTDHRPYEGLHQIIADREIDPSLPPVPFPQLLAPETGNDTWPPSPVNFPAWPPAPVNFAQFGGSLTRFLDDIASEPTLDRVVMVNDDNGDTWVLLDARIDQGDPDADKPGYGLQQSLYVSSWFVPTHHATHVLPHLPRIIRSGSHDIVDSHGHVDCCYFGEIGWSPHDCPNRHADFSKLDADGKKLAVVNSVEDYTWEGSLYDCSIDSSVMTTLPSTFVRSRSSLTMTEHGPSWSDNGIIVFTNHAAVGRNRQQGFLVHASWLRAFLKEHDLELLLAASALRWRLTSGFPRSRDHDPEEDNRLDLYAAARIDVNLHLELAPTTRLRNNEEAIGPEED